MLRPGAGASGAKGTAGGRTRSPRAPSPRANTAAKPTSPTSPSKREKKLLEEYVVGATLGEGAFGVVRICRHRQTGKEFAVKMVDKVETPVPAIMREADMLKEMQHPNIVKFVDIFIERCFVCIVMEIYRGGDLVDGLQRQGPFDAMQIVHVAYQTAAAIHHLHARMVAHRDIKGDNCMMDREDMLDAECRVVLTDFGTAAVAKPDEPFTSQVGTRQFWSPELLDKSYGLSVDIWALGVLMYGLVTGRFPFRDEADIRKKEVKIRTKVDANCKEYILNMLKKDPAERLTSAQIMAHPYLGSMTSAKEKAQEAPQEEAFSEANVPEMIREDGANVGIKDRRGELIERLHQEHTGSKGTTVRPVQGLDFQPFVVESKNRPGTKLAYDWWDEGRVSSSGLLDLLANAAPLAQDGRDATDLTLFSTMLQEHGIDPSKFGAGSSKSLKTLADEVRSGEARLMLDATAHKKLVRVVEIVVVRLRAGAEDKCIVEVAVDSTDRGKYDTLRLPAKIKPPHENTKRCCERVLATLGLDETAVALNVDGRGICEEEYESPSYPGVMTIYKKEIVEGIVDIAALGAEKGASVGLPDFQAWTMSDAKGSRFYEWMTEGEADARNVQFYTKGSEEVSTLVQAPIGMNVNDLEARLKNANIDISQFGKNGARSMKDLSEELYRGAAFISEGEQGELVRTVNVVLVILRDAKTNRMLVQTSLTDEKGAEKAVPRLPGNKCRPDENHFICARQTVQREIELDENALVFDETVRFVEEVQVSPNYPGIKTVYRKFLVTANI